MRLLPLHTFDDWTAAAAALPAAGPLPARTVLVASERQAHALRRALVRDGRATALAGLRFSTPLQVALEVLARAGQPASPGEEALRPARLLALFGEDLPLEHYPLHLLRTHPGWEEAFAQAIGALEQADLSPADLPAGAAPERDLALVWRRVVEAAGRSWTAARILVEATRLLERDPAEFPFPGPVLAGVTGHEGAALARLLRAIPDLTLGLWLARPASSRHLERLSRLFGPAARAAVEEALRAQMLLAPRAGQEPSERDLLAAYLFQPPEVLGAPDRPRSRGPDGTVLLEEHAGVEAEVEAATGWVARQLLETGVPLQEVAVLVPAGGPLAQLVAERLSRLPCEGGALPVFVAGGLPASATSAGSRLLATVRALASNLSASALAAVLPALHLAPRPTSHLSHGEAMELAFALGTAGGNAAFPEGALEWSPRAEARAAELTHALAHARKDEDSAARETRRLERTLADLEAARPALDALVGVARTVVGGASLAAIWEALHGFAVRWLHLPGDAPGQGAALVTRLAESLAPACAGPLGRALTGTAALAVVEERLLALRLPTCRFGTPAVYVGTVASAAGLEHSAVRVLGLCEGVLPSLPRENPVLPGALRAALEEVVPGRVLPREEDQVAAQLHGLFRVVQGARRAVAISAPRVDLARTEREPGAVFIEAAAALGRPEAGAVIPDLRALSRDHFAPARAEGRRFREAHPVDAAAWLERAAAMGPEMPAAWSAAPALDLARITRLRARSGPLGPADGVLGPGRPFPVVPGLEPERPISASALQHLLQCPRMFLMRRVLGWDEPAAAPSLRELEPAAFGSLLHEAVEAFFRAHGRAFVAGQASLAHWQDVAAGLAAGCFTAFLSGYPLVGERIREKERRRLLDAVSAFLTHDWAQNRRGRRFVGVEVGFGEGEPLALRAGSRTLHVRGFIDRLDVDGDVTTVRDLKSGKHHPRTKPEAGPTALRDVQLGLYLLTVKRLARELDVPARAEGAYVYADGKGDVEERAFRGDAAELEAATEEWLATSATLLEARAFTATPVGDDCRYCPFMPLCGDAEPLRAAEGLRPGCGDEGGAGEALAAYGRLKLGDEEEET